jgi:hypothetical protein
MTALGDISRAIVWESKPTTSLTLAGAKRRAESDAYEVRPAGEEPRLEWRPSPVAVRSGREAAVWPEGQRALRGIGGDKLPRALEVVPRHQDLARTAVAYSVAGTSTHVRLAVIAGDSFRPQEAADRLCLHRVSDNHESHSVHQPAYLAECEHVCLSAGLEELDLQRSLANPVVLSHELVEAALPEQAVPVLVHVHAV